MPTSLHGRENERICSNSNSKICLRWRSVKFWREIFKKSAFVGKR